MKDATFRELRARKRVGTVDLTPTWKGVLPLLLIGLENGTETGKRMAREDLIRMAEAADLWNASQKPMTDDEIKNSNSPKAQAAATERMRPR